jgi:DNA-binding transcriptional ArsR family regulator
MTVRIPMTVASLGSSRIASSAAVEVLGALRAHAVSAGAPHVARWRERAIRRLRDDDLQLLTGIAGGRAPYVPDFLTPPPQRPVIEMADAAEAIAGTDPAEIDYHLDIAFRDRPIRPNVAELFGGPEGLERRRQEMPEGVRLALRDGPVALAERVAAAMVRYFDAAIAPDWPRVRDVLQADMAYRGVRIAEKGPIALLDDLDHQLNWSNDAVELARPWDLTIDWAHAGVLLVPTTTNMDGVTLIAEAPAPPMLIYPARATASLWGEADVAAEADVVDLIGHTRAALLSQLSEPVTTGELSRRLGLTPGTVSYHLGILRRAGLVRRSRRGSQVTYVRSDRGHHLLRL